MSTAGNGETAPSALRRCGQTRRMGTSRPVEHPGRQLLATGPRLSCSTCSERQRHQPCRSFRGSPPASRTTDANDKAVLEKKGSVSVLKPCCTITADRIRALTTRHPIAPASNRRLPAWQPNPGRSSTYRRGNSVQTTGATSISRRISALMVALRWRRQFRRQGRGRVVLIMRLVRGGGRFGGGWGWGRRW
jgi:hypothetical protein